MRSAAALALLALCACSTGEQRPELPQEVTRIAFGSCALQWEEQPIWDAIVAADPDLFLFMGDAIYGDWDGEQALEVTPESMRSEWAELGARPELRRLRESVPVLATWDNHDYGKHDGGADFALKEDARQAFLDFFEEPAGSQRRNTPGLYDAHVFGPSGQRVQVILLDTRFFKGPSVDDPRSEEEKAALGVVGKYLPNEDPTVTLLGDAQWAWLERQLEAPADVRLIASSTQVVADQKGMDEWGNYPGERSRLLRLIERTGATGVVFLSGNVHFAELSRVDGPYPLYDATASGLTHVEPRYAAVANPYRVAGPYVDLNFGLVDIDWAARTVKLSAQGLDGAPAYAHTVSLDSLCSREPLEEPFRVLLLGDSISIGYTKPVRRLLGERAVVVRPTNANGGAENCAGTNKGVENLDRWLALEGGEWDVIHFNFGLHDLKRVVAETGRNSNNPDDPYQADPERYERQLRQIVSRLEATGARLIYATTTPVPLGVRPYRAPTDPVIYNAIARRIMEEHGIAIDNLEGFAIPRLAEIQRAADVHFTPAGSEALAEQVAASILSAASRR